jgi:hypothetical protein
LDQRADYDGSLPGMQEVIEDFTTKKNGSRTRLLV